MGQAGLAFRELLAPVEGLDPAQVQRRASDLLPERVAASHLRWWTPGDPIPSTGVRLLIGVAVWSGYDLRLLDYVDAAAAEAGPGGPLVDVFDTDIVRRPEVFEPYVPGLGEVFQTPIVGHWVDGELVRSGAGYDGRKLIVEVLSLDLAVLISRPVVAPVR